MVIDLLSIIHKVEYKPIGTNFDTARQKDQKNYSVHNLQYKRMGVLIFEKQKFLYLPG